MKISSGASQLDVTLCSHKQVLMGYSASDLQLVQPERTRDISSTLTIPSSRKPHLQLKLGTKPLMGWCQPGVPDPQNGCSSFDFTIPILYKHRDYFFFVMLPYTYPHLLIRLVTQRILQPRVAALVSPSDERHPIGHCWISYRCTKTPMLWIDTTR